jgi:hypothetical protein
LFDDGCRLVSTTTFAFRVGRGKSSIDGLRSLAASFVLGGEPSKLSLIEEAFGDDRCGKEEF